MKRVHVAKHAPEAHIVRGYLESNGIAAEVRGDLLTSGWGDLPLDVCGVWIRDDGLFQQATDLLTGFLNGAAAREHAHERWTCARCNEPIEGQFTDCWNCGAARA